MTRSGAWLEAADRPHVLMVTNHGLHEWNVTAGLPDTGGQNIYVNYLSATLARLGFRVTTSNRGGYPHPATGLPREGESFRDSFERIVYTSDHVHQFVRKEDMEDLTAEIAHNLAKRLEREPPPELIISHYWDGALVASGVRELLRLEAPHIWIPHSLGVLKRRNVPAEQWAALRIDERIEAERRILRSVELVGSTSGAVTETIRDEYGFDACVFLPPCVDPDRFNPNAAADDRAVALLSAATGRSSTDVSSSPVVTEVSRTAKTKRKDLLIRAFADVRRHHEDAILAITIDRSAPDVYADCTGLIANLNLQRSVAVLGSIQDDLPSLYGHSAIYCTPSIMEGFGMSIQEAAACGVPAVASTRVPFAVEYLRGHNPNSVMCDEDGSTLQVGSGAIIVEPDSVAAVSAGLGMLLGDPELRTKMGTEAARITVPYFTWEQMTRRFLEEAHIPIPLAAEQ